MNRRRFLGIGGGALTAAFMPPSAVALPVPPVLPPPPVPVPVANPILEALMGAKEALFPAGAECTETSFSSLWEKCVNHMPPYTIAPRIDPAEYLVEFYSIAKGLFGRVSTYMKHITVLQSHPEEAKKFLEEADRIISPQYTSEALDQALFIVGQVRDFAIAAVSSPEEKMQRLESYYKHRGPSPFNSSSIAWEKPAAEVFSELADKMSTLETALRQNPAEALKIMETQGPYVFSFQGFVFTNGGDVPYAEMAERHTAEYSRRCTEAGIDENLYHILHYGHGLEMDWPDYVETGSYTKNKIAINIGDKPEEVVLRLCRSVKNMKNQYSANRAEYYPFTDPTSADHPNKKACEEICNNLGASIDSWLPELVADYFPEVWRAMQGGQHEELRREIKMDQPAPRNRQREAYYDRIWAELLMHGNDYY